MKTALSLIGEWQILLCDEKEEYFFPHPITNYMKLNYKYPAIYRWNVYSNSIRDESLLYIGEAQSLCPDRLKNYLKPGPSQKTSRRIHDMFNEFSSQGMKIQMEVFDFERITIDEVALVQKDLSQKHVRLLIEQLLVTIYRRKGVTLLNL